MTTAILYYDHRMGRIKNAWSENVTKIYGRLRSPCTTVKIQYIQKSKICSWLVTTCGDRRVEDTLILRIQVVLHKNLGVYKASDIGLLPMSLFWDIVESRISRRLRFLHLHFQTVWHKILKSLQFSPVEIQKYLILYPRVDDAILDFGELDTVE